MPAEPETSPDHPPDPTTSSTPPPIDPAVRAEQAYLDSARAALATMRDRTLSLDAGSAGGGALSIEYLKSALHRRALALADDPETPLFFGRLDYAEAPDHGGEERFYVGRRHVHDDHGDPLVVDWRAGISRAFYRATHVSPMGVALRRRFGFHRGRVTAYEDEHLQDRREPELRSQILAAEIERPRVGPMRDIVATIQPEQDEIVRADVTQSVCVQGAPGTGKTAVGLHRAAFLLYAHRDKLRRSGVLVVGPNLAFLGYIAAVLPALGEVEVAQVTVEGLVARQGIRLRADDPVEVARLKGDARMADVLRRAVWSYVQEPPGALVLPRGSRRWRVPTHEVRELLDQLRSRGVHYGAARAMLPQRLAHGLLVQMEEAGESPDDRVQDAVARTRIVKAYVDAVWPSVEPSRVVWRLLSDADFLRTSADGLLTGDEQALLLWTSPSKGPGSAKWSAADAVLVDEAADLIDRQPSLGHVILDEAQDLSPMQLRAVGRRASTGSVTVLGDIAQGTTPWATGSWEESLAHLGKPGATLEILDRGYRVPAKVIDFASRLLPRIAPDVAPPVSVRDNPGVLDLVPSGEPSAVVAAVRAALASEGTVGLIVADAAMASTAALLEAEGIPYALMGSAESLDARLDLVPATLAKGLEFDHVVVVEPADIVAAEGELRRGLRRLYVVLTRAVSGLTVVHAKPLPDDLAA